MSNSGLLQPGDGAGDFGAQSFLVRQILSRVNTATLVSVVSVTNTGDLSAVGFVDVQPMVNQVDGANNSVPQGILHRLPYFRIQGGTDAIIIDPKVGDIGIAVFASRDISTVKNTKAQANPGSGAQFSMSDGLYLGGVLNGVPVQYVQFSAAGIKIHSPTAVILEAPDVQIIASTVEVNASSSTTITTPTFTVNGATMLNGPLSQGTGAGGGGATMAGPVAVATDVTAGGKSLTSHTHGGVQAGGSNTGTPN